MTTATAPVPCTVTPLADRVLIKMDETDERSEGGVILPATSRERPAYGIVIAVGPTVGAATQKILEDVPSPARAAMGLTIPQIRPGNRVLVSQYAGEDVQDGETTLRLIREDDVKAIIKDD